MINVPPIEAITRQPTSTSNLYSSVNEEKNEDEIVLSLENQQQPYRQNQDLRSLQSIQEDNRSNNKNSDIPYEQEGRFPTSSAPPHEKQPANQQTVAESVDNSNGTQMVVTGEAIRNSDLNTKTFNSRANNAVSLLLVAQKGPAEGREARVMGTLQSIIQSYSEILVTDKVNDQSGLTDGQKVAAANMFRLAVVGTQIGKSEISRNYKGNLLDTLKTEISNLNNSDSFGEVNFSRDNFSNMMDYLHSREMEKAKKSWIPQYFTAKKLLEKRISAFNNIKDSLNIDPPNIIASTTRGSQTRSVQNRKPLFKIPKLNLPKFKIPSRIKYIAKEARDISYLFGAAIYEICVAIPIVIVGVLASIIPLYAVSLCSKKTAQDMFKGLSNIGEEIVLAPAKLGRYLKRNYNFF
ncbi:hypothetical protein HOG98_08705 [bacterium]|jgi:hypothetical protein|nr:hypothetical protein [bacterium]